MSTQNNTTIGAITFSIDILKQLKSTLQSEYGVNKELSYAIGGIVATLTSNLLKICSVTFKESLSSDSPNARDDLIRIQLEFNELINSMLEEYKLND